MNILIVDDDKYVLDGMIQGVDWDSLPFDNRYFARNAAEAKEIMNQVQIRVLLCDIEMPGENGLDLLAWVREQKKELQAVFLTSYAEFDYAKRAIQLGSFDYYLKPIDYKKLRDILQKAAEKVTVEEEIRRNSILGQYWISSEGERKATFWNDIVCGRMGQSLEIIQESIDKYRLSYDLTQNFIVLAIHLNPKTQADWRDDGMVCYQLTNTYMECLEDTEKISMEALWKDSVDLWFMILEVSCDGNDLWKLAGGAASHMRKKLRKYYKEFAVYLSEKANLDTIHTQAVQIRQMLFNNIAYGNGVFFVCDYKPETEQDITIDQKWIEACLMKEEEDVLKQYIEDSVEQLGKEKFLNTQTIRKILIEWMQTVFLYLHKHQIEADRLFATDEYKELYEKAEKTLSGCREYLFYLVEESVKYGRQIKESQDIIEKIEEYIWEHLGEELSRSSFTKIVYLNPDYLAYVFKKSKGISLIKYINNCRMEKAKELLLTTNMNIYNVALQVGYPTSSYFTKQFKHCFGIGPSEYRSQKKEMM